MKWTISPADEPDVPAILIEWTPVEIGSNDGRATLVHLHPTARDAMAAVRSVLHGEPVEIPGALWNRTVHAPHTAALDQFVAAIDRLAPDQWVAVQESPPGSPHAPEDPWGAAHQMVAADIWVAAKEALATIADAHSALARHTAVHLIGFEALIDLPDSAQFDEGDASKRPVALNRAMKQAIRGFFAAGRSDAVVIPLLDEWHAHLHTLAVALRRSLRGEGADESKLARYSYGELLDRTGGEWLAWRLAQ